MWGLVTYANWEASKNGRDSLRVHRIGCMELTSKSLAERIRARGLPEAVAAIAVHGGESVHPSLWYRAQSIDLSEWSPASCIGRDHGDADWLPLWASGSATEIVFSLPDGTFCQWSADADEEWERWASFGDAVRYLLTDLYEDEVGEEDREQVAALLLPRSEVAAALKLEDR